MLWEDDGLLSPPSLGPSTLGSPRCLVGSSGFHANGVLRLSEAIETRRAPQFRILYSDGCRVNPDQHLSNASGRFLYVPKLKCFRRSEDALVEQLAREEDTGTP